MLKRIFHSILPFYCILCSNQSDTTYDLCSACRNELPWLTHYCQHCGHPLGTLALHCGECLQKTIYYDKTLVLFHYQFPLPRLITHFKFHNKLNYAKIFSYLLLEKITQQKNLPEAILPVPLHKRRLKERGYNQALELGKPIAKYLKLPLLTSHCVRNKYTAAQSSLPANRRYQNIKKAFALELPIPFSHIAIIDDVITTGHTLNELSKLLKQHHVKKIDVWCVAKTQRI